MSLKEIFPVTKLVVFMVKTWMARRMAPEEKMRGGEGGCWGGGWWLEGRRQKKKKRERGRGGQQNQKTKGGEGGGYDMESKHKRRWGKESHMTKNVSKNINTKKH